MGEQSQELGDLEFGPEEGLDPSRGRERACQVLETMRRVAVWGASDNELRKSFRVVRFLAEQGLAVVPLGNASVIAGLPTTSSVDSLDHPGDVVAVFCAPGEVAEVARTLAGTPVAAVWFQEGLMDPAAARQLEAAGKAVVMDRCVMRDYRRHVLGEEVESWFPV
jgi:predicted CoA-binding protein